MHAPFYQFLQPLLGKEFVDVRLTDASGHTGKKPGTETMFQPADRLVENVLPAPPLVAGDFAAFDADEWRRIGQFAQTVRNLLGDELPVGEKLEVTVLMRREQFQQLRVHERLAAKDAEEGIAVPL